MTIKELVERSGDGALQTALHTLEEDAAFGRAQRGEMEKEVVSLGLLLDFGASEAVLKKAAAALDGAGLAPELSVAPRDTVGPCHIVRRRALCKR